MRLKEFERLEARARLRSRTYLAVKAGVLQKTPCMCCGAAKTEAHHPDYDNALAVVWLCKPHHEQIHHPGPGDEHSTRWNVSQDAFA